MIYFDNNATTPIREEVVDAMLPYFKSEFGNPSSAYPLGFRANKALEEARQSILNSLDSADGGLIFTSGGSEADNLAIKPILASVNYEKYFCTSTIEHAAIMNSCKILNAKGKMLKSFPNETICAKLFGVDENCVINCKDLTEFVVENHDKIALVSIMAANNEVGTLQPIEEIGKFLKNYGILFHVDAVQSIGWLGLPKYADMVSMAGHKINAPKGIGALYLSPEFKDKYLSTYTGIISGGKQEFSIRGGTENVPYAVGLAKAMELTVLERDSKVNHTKEMVRYMRDNMEHAIPDVKFNTPLSVPTLPNTLNVSFPGLDGAALASFLADEDMCVSTGSACSTGSAKPSHVLTEMGLSDEDAFASIRISLGGQNTFDEIDKFIETLKKGVAHLRKISGYEYK